MSDRPNALPWYRKSDARYGPTNFLIDAAAKFIGQPLYDAYKGIGQAAGFEQDPNAPKGYVSHDALNRAANGIAAGQVMGSGFARAPAGALRSGAAVPDLDMSQAARMQRAREMGFDPETVWYHGTHTGGFDNFDVSRNGRRRETNNGFAGVSMTTSPDEASSYAGAWLNKRARRDPKTMAEKFGLATPPIRYEFAGVDMADGRASVYPIYARVKNPFSWRGLKDEPHPIETDRWAYSDRLRQEGYDALDIYDGDSIVERVVFDPSNIRSVNAAFDPAKSSSSNLMAADPFAGAIVPTYPQPQRRNQLPMTF